MTFAVDVFWSFRSPCSCLATPRLVALQRDCARLAEREPLEAVSRRDFGYPDATRTTCARGALS